MKKQFTFSIYTILVLLFCAPTTRAESVNLSIDPPVVEILIAPGKKVVQNFTFSYQGDKATVTPEIHLVKPNDEQGHVTIDPNPIKAGSLSLIVSSSIPLNIPYTLEPKTANLPITLTLEAANTDQPEDVYLALVLKTSPADRLQTISTTSPAISALILSTITPSDGIPINLEVKNFTLPLLHDSWSALTLSAILENHTSTMVRPEGTFEVISPRGKSKQKLDLYPNLILGNASRSLLDKNSNPLSWSPAWYDIGPYRLHLTINSEAGTKLTETEKIVWVLPLRIIIGISLFLLIMGIVIIKTHTRKVTIDTDL